MTDCRVCRSNSGAERISPAPTIHDGEHWLVEHAYPSALLGWLVIVLRRHAEALHELTREEAEELGALQWAVATSLKAKTDCLKEYSVFFAEGEGFAHVHLHMVPRARDLAPELRSGRVFGFLQAPQEDVVAPQLVRKFCEEIAEGVRGRLGG